MKWIIRHICSDMYAVSPRFLVYNEKFARRFSTKKQAEAYMTSSGFDKIKYVAEELHDKTMENDRSTLV